MNYTALIGLSECGTLRREFTAFSDKAALARATSLAKAATREGMAKVQHDLVVLWRGPIGVGDTLESDDYGGRYIAVRGSVWDKRETWDRSRRFVDE